MFYAISVTTKKIPKEYTKKGKEKGNQNVTLQKNQLNTKEGSKGVNEYTKA